MAQYITIEGNSNDTNLVLGGSNSTINATESACCSEASVLVPPYYQETFRGMDDGAPSDSCLAIRETGVVMLNAIAGSNNVNWLVDKVLKVTKFVDAVRGPDNKIAPNQRAMVYCELTDPVNMMGRDYAKYKGMAAGYDITLTLADDPLMTETVVMALNEEFDPTVTKKAPDGRWKIMSADILEKRMVFTADLTPAFLAFFLIMLPIKKMTYEPSTRTAIKSEVSTNVGGVKNGKWAVSEVVELPEVYRCTVQATPHADGGLQKGVDTEIYDDHSLTSVYRNADGSAKKKPGVATNYSMTGRHPLINWDSVSETASYLETEGVQEFKVMDPGILEMTMAGWLYVSQMNNFNPQHQCQVVLQSQYIIGIPELAWDAIITLPAAMGSMKMSWSGNGADISLFGLMKDVKLVPSWDAGEIVKDGMGHDNLQASKPSGQFLMGPHIHPVLSYFQNPDYRANLFQFDLPEEYQLNFLDAGKMSIGFPAFVSSLTKNFKRGIMSAYEPSYNDLTGKQDGSGGHPMVDWMGFPGGEELTYFQPRVVEKDPSGVRLYTHPLDPSSTMVTDMKFDASGNPVVTQKASARYDTAEHPAKAFLPGMLVPDFRKLMGMPNLLESELPQTTSKVETVIFNEVFLMSKAKWVVVSFYKSKLAQLADNGVDPSMAAAMTLQDPFFTFDLPNGLMMIAADPAHPHMALNGYLNPSRPSVPLGKRGTSIFPYPGIISQNFLTSFITESQLSWQNTDPTSTTGVVFDGFNLLNYDKFTGKAVFFKAFNEMHFITQWDANCVSETVTAEWANNTQLNSDTVTAHVQYFGIPKDDTYNVLSGIKAATASLPGGPYLTSLSGLRRTLVDGVPETSGGVLTNALEPCPTMWDMMKDLGEISAMIAETAPYPFVTMKQLHLDPSNGLLAQGMLIQPGLISRVTSSIANPIYMQRLLNTELPVIERELQFVGDNRYMGAPAALLSFSGSQLFIKVADVSGGDGTGFDANGNIDFGSIVGWITDLTMDIVFNGNDTIEAATDGSGQYFLPELFQPLIRGMFAGLGLDVATRPFPKEALQKGHFGLREQWFLV